MISYLFSHFNFMLMVEWCQNCNFLKFGKHSCIIYMASWLVRFKVPHEVAENVDVLRTGLSEGSGYAYCSVSVPSSMRLEPSCHCALLSSAVNISGARQKWSLSVQCIMHVNLHKWFLCTLFGYCYPRASVKCLASLPRGVSRWITKG